MRLISLICLSIFAISSISAQNRFRVDYDLIATYQNGKWDGWTALNHTFVFNSNENGDVIHYLASGEKDTYRRISSIEKGELEGNSYHIFTAIDESGFEIIIQYFDDSSIGLKLILSPDYMIQFSKKQK